jgi:hypothetical protein
MRYEILPVMLKLFVAILVLVLALTVGSLTVFAKGSRGQPDNVAATRAYLLARHKLGLAGQSDQEVGEAAVQALVARVKSECPGVLAEAPRSQARSDIRAEIADEVPLTLERPARGATLAFAATVQRLHWSNPKLTYYATHSAKEEAAKENVALPDICTDARGLAASGFKMAPTTTESFLASFGAANSITTIVFRPGETGGDLEEQISRLLRPYERPDEKALLPASRRSPRSNEQCPLLKKTSGRRSSKSLVRSGSRNEPRSGAGLRRDSMSSLPTTSVKLSLA